MSQTFTPELDPAVLERLAAYALGFRPLFPRRDQFRQGQLYLHGLLLDGERKSIEPLSRRVPGGDEQRLQQFVNQSPWDPAPVLAAYRAGLAPALAHPAGIIVMDDTSFPKQGRHSVGVARQYRGALGQRANCHVAVSLHYATPAGDYPLALRLYLPESWTSDLARLKQARVPEAEQTFQTKWQLALSLLDLVRAEGLPHAVVVADAGYGVGTEFREGLEQRAEHYILGLSGEEVVLTEPPRWIPHIAKGHRGRPATRAYLAPEGPQPMAIRALADTLERTPVRWRDGTKGPLAATFAWVRSGRSIAGKTASRRTRFRPVRKPAVGCWWSGARMGPSSTRCRTCRPRRFWSKPSRGGRNAGKSSAGTSNLRMNWAWITLKGVAGTGSITTRP